MTPDNVAQVVSRWTGVPVDKMLEGERDKLLKMEQELAKRVVGQAEAVAAVSTAVRRARAGLQDPNRPIGSFMFLGPTGVGKTELTKALASFLFDDETALVRIDMSEYMEKHSVARLIGAPPGYVGYDEGGALTEAVRRRPYQVVLFDEIEKAHPDVFNVLLQVLDDGRLTDGQGRTVDFRNVLIVMTSNLGSDYLVNQPEGEDTKAVEKDVMNVVRGHFRPEFLNRVDEIILFHRLRREDMGSIVDIQFKRLAKLLEERKIELALDAKGRQWLADKGYDSAYGARPSEARHPEMGAGPAGAGDPRRRGARRADGQGERRARPSHHRRQAGRRRGGRGAAGEIADGGQLPQRGVSLGRSGRQAAGSALQAQGGCRGAEPDECLSRRIASRRRGAAAGRLLRRRPAPGDVRLRAGDDLRAACRARPPRHRISGSPTCAISAASC